MDRILYVSDLDGTLLNRESKISKYTADTINNLIEKGMIFTYATARSLYSALPVTKGLTTNLPVIIYNGCAIVNAKTKDVLYQQGFSIEQSMYIKEKMKKYCLNPLVYAYIDGAEKVSYYRDKTNEGILHYLNKRTGDPRFIPILEGDIYQGNIFYYTCIGNKEDLEPMYLEIKDDKEYHVLFHQELYRKEYWLEIMPVKATKANAIKELKKMLKVDKIISFGDAINDIPMFSISDACYAVENAVPKLKDIATGCIESNEEDGVAKWLKKHVKQDF